MSTARMEEEAKRSYLREGERRAAELGNRGPIRFQRDGSLHPEILEAYSRCGFYIFEGVLHADELADLEADIGALRERFPVASSVAVDAEGRTALGVGHRALTLIWSKPLADPWGGTPIANGRHQVKMSEPEAAADAPEEVVLLLLGSLQFSDACLRVYGHPELLSVAAQINGDDFTPFNEAIFIKDPGLGASVSWHQDGTTHWDGPLFDETCHGFNFMAQLYRSTPANGVWVIPGSHVGKVDIAALAAKAGSDRLPDAVPIVCGAGDVAMTNRQIVHGSFPNESADPRITINFGFHRRSSVLGAVGAGIHAKSAVYDEARIRERSRVIGYAIDARRQRFPDESPYEYRPFVESGDTFRWDDHARAGLKDYNLLDLSI